MQQNYNASWAAAAGPSRQTREAPSRGGLAQKLGVLVPSSEAPPSKPSNVRPVPQVCDARCICTMLFTRTRVGVVTGFQEPARLLECIASSSAPVPTSEPRQNPSVSFSSVSFLKLTFCFSFSLPSVRSVARRGLLLAGLKASAQFEEAWFSGGGLPLRAAAKSGVPLTVRERSLKLPIDAIGPR